MPSFKIFLDAVSDIEVQSFSVFQIWLAHHVIYDVIIIIETFYMSNCSNGEKFVYSNKQLQRKTRKFCADKQTNRHTEKQTNGPKCNTPSDSFGDCNNQIRIWIRIFTKIESICPCPTPNMSTKFHPNPYTTF